jgi:hypothetical protein
MKKFAAVLALMCMVSALSFARASEDQEFILKAGIQPEGTVKIDSYNDADTKIGFSLGVEYYKYLNNIVALGGGANYDIPRKFKDSNYTVSFLPFYAAVKVRMPLKGLENNYPFMAARLGYSAFMAEDDWASSTSGGLYAGISAGYCIGSLFLEGSYSYNGLSVKPFSSGPTYDGSYSTVAFYIGVKID